ncbi:endonuclease/exonuclease/phosphatase family protein [Candidatus Saccharibacteria bacterium]|nr:endonuclease/exonuclease/phosphatase family protein [Candidatus Saccharibacteria bacterium]
MSEIKVATWNTLNSLGDPERRSHAVSAINRTGADIVWLGEAAFKHDDQSQYNLGVALNTFASEGYQALVTDVSRDPRHRNNHSNVMLSRDTATHPRQFQTGVRLGAWSDVGGVAVVGVLLPDYSSTEREKGIQDVLAVSHEGPMVIMGDFNAMYRHGWRPSVARRVAAISRALPGGNIKNYYDSRGVERARGLIERLGDMASDTVMQLATEYGFTSADPAHAPTVGNPPLFCIDHILVNSGLNVRIFNQVQPTSNRGPLSDHKMLTATIRY